MRSSDGRGVSFQGTGGGGLTPRLRSRHCAFYALSCCGAHTLHRVCASLASRRARGFRPKWPAALPPVSEKFPNCEISSGVPTQGVWWPPDNGQCSSCSGTTMSTGTAASAMLPRHSVVPDGIAVCSKPATRSIKVRGNATRDAGVGRRVTGRRIVTLNPERDA
jgi:hypothetical protein